MGLAPVGNDHAVWTGTIVGGSTATDTCDYWSLSIGSGEVGDFTLAGAKWASNGGRNCAQGRALLLLREVIARRSALHDASERSDGARHVVGSRGLPERRADAGGGVPGPEHRLEHG